MRTKTQIVAAMRYLAKNNKNLSFKEFSHEIVLYRNDVAFHGTIMKLTKRGKFWDVLDLSSKLKEL